MLCFAINCLKFISNFNNLVCCHDCKQDGHQQGDKGMNPIGFLKIAFCCSLFLLPAAVLANEAENHRGLREGGDSLRLMGGGDVGDVCRGNADCQPGLICTSRDPAGNGFCQPSILTPIPPINPPTCQ
jgi:hypothetical protein